MRKAKGRSGIAAGLLFSMGALAADPPSLLEFATKSVGGAADPDLQVNLGALAARREAAAAQGPGNYFDSNSGRFKRWCGKHGGEVTVDSGPEALKKIAGSLWPAQFTNDDAVWSCLAPTDRSVIAVVLRGAPRHVSVPSWGGGSRPAYEFRYAFFDAESWTELGNRDAMAAQSREVTRAVSQDIARVGAEHRQQETARLRSSPQIGDRTAVGLIVEIRGPLALVQLIPEQRAIRGIEQEWLRIDALEAP